MSATVALICPTCNCQFKRRKAEYTRSLKKNRKSYCSRTCSSNTEANLTRMRELGLSKDMKELSKLGNSKKSENACPFLYYLRKARARSRNKKYKETNKKELSVEYLEKLWKKQKGCCKYTKVPLILPKPQGWVVRSPFMASLDRIDSSIGYVEGNVAFVAYSVNMAKSDFTEKTFKSFLSEIAKNIIDKTS